MQIGKPTNHVPGSDKAQRGKYEDVFLAVKKLKDNEWLPVQFSSAHDAYNFRVRAANHRTLQLDVKLRGSAVYIRMKPAENGSKAKEKR